MPLALTDVTRTVEVNAWEGGHRVAIDWTLDQDDDPDVIETQILSCNRGGGVSGWRREEARMLGRGPELRADEAFTEACDEGEPVHGRLMLVTSEPHGRPAMRNTRPVTVPLVCGPGTFWMAGIEERPAGCAELRAAPPMQRTPSRRGTWSAAPHRRDGAR